LRRVPPLEAVTLVKSLATEQMIKTQQGSKTVAAHKTLIFIPTYEERLNVEPMCNKLLEHAPDAEILFMDDNSPDGTGDVLDSLAAKHSRVKVIHRAGKLGVGGAHLEGIAYAYDHGYDRLVTLDCDFTHSPEDVPKLCAQSEHADIAVGSRFLAEDSLPGWNLVRRVLTKAGHVMTMNMLGIGEDATGAFRVYRLDRIPREMFALIKTRGYSFFFESLFIARQNDLRIREVPIKLPARTYGHSKMSVREIQRSVGQLLTLAVAQKTNPAQFRIARPFTDINKDLVDPQNWDEYWQKKQHKASLVYEVVAAMYRNTIIKQRLTATIAREFPSGAHLLHAGCGSGQVDTDLHERMMITAVDISVPALEIYRRENPHAHDVKHASIFDLPFPSGTFDGAYNLGVVEHFEREQLQRALREVARTLKAGAKMVIFWPHANATSVMVLDSIHFVMNDVLHKNVRLHPPEVSLVHNETEARDILASSGFDLRSYSFGPRDLFVQAIVVAQRQN